MDAQKTGKLIRELRLKRNMTQQDLAGMLHVSPTAVSKWENGHSLPDISLLEPLAETLGVSVSCLILGETADSGAERRHAVHTEKTDEERAVTEELPDRHQKRSVYMIRYAVCIIAVVMFVRLSLRLSAYDYDVLPEAVIILVCLAVNAVFAVYSADH